MIESAPNGSESTVPPRYLQISQAIYGERDRGHGLLRASAGEIPATEVVPLTDRPESAPATLAWRPYVKGFVWNSWYVLARTFPDPTASRAGMVFTHAVFTSLCDLMLTPRLDEVASLLMTQVAKDRELEAVKLPIPPSDSPTYTQPAPQNTVSVATALLRANGAPIIWLGQDGFEDCIYDLWARLWPAARSALQFGLLFSPQDLEGQPLNLVATPRQFATRWTGYKVVDIAIPSQGEGAATRLDPAMEFVLERRPESELAQFFAALECTPSFGDVTLAARILPLLGQLALQGSTSSDAEALRSIARVAGKLSPDPKRGREFKRRLIDRLAEMTARGTDEDVSALRNFEMTPFDGAAQVLGTAIAHWVERAVLPESTNEHSSGTRRDVGRLILLAEGQSTWAIAVNTGIAAVFTRWSSEIARKVWSWLRTDPLVVLRLADQLPAAAADLLVQTCPLSLPVAIATAIVQDIAIPRTWDALGAAVLSAAFPPSEAYAQLRGRPTLATRSGYAVVARRVPRDETIRQALNTGDQVICEIAGELCAAEPALMSGLDPTNDAWLAVWDAASRKSRNVWLGIDNPSVILSGLIDAVLTGRSVPQALMQAAASSNHASLLDHASRSLIWGALKEEIRGLFISATADDYLERRLAGVQGTSLDADSEPLLRAAVAEESRVRRILRDADGSALARVVDLFQTLPELEESLLRDWIQEHTSLGHSASRDDALALAGLISDRGWSRSASEVASLASRYPQSTLRLTVQATANLLPLWRRILMWDWFPQHDEDDGWGALADIGARLYPWGPGDRDLWQRAGGEQSRMPIRDSGWDSWQAAITLIRYGGGGSSLSGRRLVRAMQDDFPYNDQLALLRRLPMFR